MKLTKSLAELDAAADELLKKSQTAADDDDKAQQGDGNEPTPDEISDDSVATPESEEDAEDKQDNADDLEKCGDNCGAVKKSEDSEPIKDDEDNDEGEGDEGDEGEGEEPDAENIEKSLKDDFQASPVISQGMDTSEFISAVVEVLTKSLSDVQYDTQVAARANSNSNDILAKSITAVIASNQQLKADNDRLTRRINKLEKSISQGFDKIMDSLDTISSQPAHMRKSMAAVYDKDFGASLNGAPAPTGFESLSKSQVMSILTAELYSGNPSVQNSDIISYESGAPLRTDLQSLVASKANSR